MKKMKKITLATLAMLAVGTAGASVAALNVSADTATQPTNVFAMEAGAGVRLNSKESTGIRFIAETTEREEGATYNFVIAPTYYFEEVLGTGDAKTADWVALFNGHEKIGENGYIHLTEIKPENFDKDANLEICGSVHKMLFENMNLEYTGIAYKEVGGVRTYAAFDSLSEISRSVTNVSSRALNSGLYDTEAQAGNKTIMTDFIKKGFVLKAGYEEVKDGEEVAYQLGEGEAVTLEEAYTEVKPQLVVATPDQQKLLHTYSVSATTTVDIGLDIVLTVNEADKANVKIGDGTVQTLNEKGATFTAKAGLLTATKEITVDEVTTKTATSDTIVDVGRKTVTFGAGLVDAIGSQPTAIYEVNNGALDLGYDNASGSFENAPAQLGDGKYAVRTNDNTYYVSAVASDYVIKTAGDYVMYLRGVTSMGTTMTTTRRDAKYAILANDIDSGHAYNKGERTGESTLKNPAGAVLDGRGFIVSSFDAQFSIFGYGYQSGNAGTVCETSTIKDYTVKNITFSQMYGGHNWTLARYLENCTFENVNVGVRVNVGSCQIFQRGGGSDTQNAALLAQKATNTTFTNCTFRFDAPDGTRSDAIRLFENQDTSVTFNNTTMSSLGFNIALPGDTDGPSGVVQTWTMTEGSTLYREVIGMRHGGKWNTFTVTNNTVTIEQVNAYIKSQGNGATFDATQNTLQCIYWQSMAIPAVKQADGSYKLRCITSRLAALTPATQAGHGVEMAFHVTNKNPTLVTKCYVSFTGA